MRAKGLEVERKTLTREDNVRKVNQAISDGAGTRKEISEVSGLCYQTVSKIIRSEGLEGVGKSGVGRRELGDEDLDNVVRALMNGHKNINDITESSGLKYGRVNYLIKKYDIFNVKGERKPRRESKRIREHMRDFRRDVRKYAMRGYSLEVIGKKTGRGKERVRQVINAEKIYEGWRYARKQFKGGKDTRRINERVKNKIVRDVADSILLNAHINGGFSEWAVEQARKYFIVHPQTIAPFGEFARVFENYKAAEEEGKRLSLEELSDGTGFLGVNVGRILSDVDLKPMFGTLDRHSTPKWKKEAVDRSAFQVDMSAPDIGHFVGLPGYVVSERLKKIGKRPWVKNHIAFFGSGKYLKYRMASQIYEAKDLGFSVGETVELLDVTKEMVEYAESHKKKIASEIRDALEVLYPDKKIRKPYVDFNNNNL